MNERETTTSPPDTLIGLGPPEPPEKYGAHPADAPETLRAWSTSGNVAADQEDPGVEPFLPLESLFPARIWPISGADEEPSEARLFRRPAARSVYFWTVPALLTAAAIGSAIAFSGERSRPAAVPHAAATLATGASTTRVVGGPWVLRQDAPAEQQDESTEPARIFFREPHAGSHRTTTSQNAPAAPAAPSAAEVEEPSPDIAPNRARVQAVADSVQLEDDVSEAKEPNAADPAPSVAE
jgi:hypothetical protein